MFAKKEKKRRRKKISVKIPLHQNQIPSTVKSVYVNRLGSLKTKNLIGKKSKELRKLKSYATYGENYVGG